jgi:hypothetical protein
MIIHEIGHRIDGYLTNKIYGRAWDHFNLDNNISNTIRGQVLKNLGLTLDDITDNLSVYGQFNEAEFLAEAFSEYISSASPRKIARMVDTIHRYLFRRTIICFGIFQNSLIHHIWLKMEI